MGGGGDIWIIFHFPVCFFFGYSSPEQKTQVNLLSVICPFHIFFFFFGTTGPITTKLGTQYPWVKGIQIY